MPPLIPEVCSLQAHAAGVDAVTWLRDDLVSAGHDGNIKLLGLVRDENGKTQFKVKKTLGKRAWTARDNKPGHRGGVYTCAANAEETLLVTGGHGPDPLETGGVSPGDLLVWKAGKDFGSTVVALAGHASAVYSANFGPGASTRVLSCNRGGTVLLHDVNRPEVPLLSKQAHTGVAHSVVFCPTAPDLYVSTGTDGHLRTGDLRVPADRFRAFWALPSTCANYQWVRAAEGIEAAHGGEVVYSAAYMGPEKILSGGADFKMKAWDMRMSAGADSGTCSKEFLGHIAAVRHVSVDETQNRAVTACADGSLRLWPLTAAAGAAPPRVDAMRALDEEIAQVSAMIKSAPAASRSAEPLSPTLVRDRAALIERRKRLVSAKERKTRNEHQEAQALLDGHCGLAACAAWKGDCVATASWDQTVRLFNVAS